MTGERQLSMDGTSRVTGDGQARFCEGLGVKFPGATRRSMAGFRCPPREVAEWLKAMVC